MAEMYSEENMECIQNCIPHFLMHSSVHGHLTWFLYFAHLRNAMINMEVQIFLWDIDFFFCDYYYANSMLENFQHTVLKYKRKNSNIWSSLITWTITRSSWTEDKGLYCTFKEQQYLEHPEQRTMTVIALKIVLAKFWLEYTVCLPNLSFPTILGSNSCTTAAVTTCRASARTRLKFPMH